MSNQIANVKRKILQHYTLKESVGYETLSFAETQYFEGIDESLNEQKSNLDFSFLRLDTLSNLGLGSFICNYGKLRYTQGKIQIPKSQSMITPIDCKTKILAFVPNIPHQFIAQTIPQVFSFQFSNGVKPFDVNMPMILCPTGTFEIKDEMSVTIPNRMFLEDDDMINSPLYLEGLSFKIQEDFSMIKTVEKPFLMCAFETPKKLYMEIMKSSKTLTRASDIQYKNSDSDDLPIHSISYSDVIQFCNKLSEIQGLDPYYEMSSSAKFHIIKRNTNANGYRLPTQNEWEYAAKAGTNNRWSGTNTETQLNRYANTSKSKTHGNLSRVDGKASSNFLPNEWGFYLMTGNALELCDNIWIDYQIDSYTTHQDISKAFSMFASQSKDVIHKFFKASQKNTVNQYSFLDFLKFLEKDGVDFSSREPHVSLKSLEKFQQYLKKNIKKIFVKGSEYPEDLLFPYKNYVLTKGGSLKDDVEYDDITIDNQKYPSSFGFHLLDRDNNFIANTPELNRERPITFRLARTVTKPSDLTNNTNVIIK